MRLYAYALFGIHTLFELAFGARAFLSGGPSALSAEQIALQATDMTIAFRFLGSALLALGIMGLIVLFWAGVGSLISAQPSFEVYQSGLALGALILHAALALGFVIYALVNKPEPAI